MDKEKTKSELKDLVTITIIIAVCILVVSVLKNYTDIQKTDAQILQEILDNKTGVSEEYRQGWNDCVNELEKLHPNTTGKGTT
jgi:hypothetical protein